MVFTGFHEPVELFWRVMVAPAIGWPDVSLSVPLIVKFWLVRVVLGLATAVSCVDVVLTSTVTAGLVALLSSALPA